jgi:hypothetical protein
VRYYPQVVTLAGLQKCFLFIFDVGQPLPQSSGQEQQIMCCIISGEPINDDTGPTLNLCCKNSGYDNSHTFQTDMMVRY